MLINSSNWSSETAFSRKMGWEQCLIREDTSCRTFILKNSYLFCFFFPPRKKTRRGGRRSLFFFAKGGTKGKKMDRLPPSPSPRLFSWREKNKQKRWNFFKKIKVLLEVLPRIKHCSYPIFREKAVSELQLELLVSIEVFLKVASLFFLFQFCHTIQGVTLQLR